MGLETTASHVIWFAAILSIAGTIATALFEQGHELVEASDAQAALHSERLRTRFSDVTFCYSSGIQKVQVFARNQGEPPIDLSEVTVLLDGVVQTSAVASVSNEGSTSQWLRFERARFVIDGVAAQPERAMLVAPRGVMAHAALTNCVAGPPASIVVTPDPVDVVAGETQQFTATVYDAEGNINTTATVTWTTNAGSIDSTGLLRAQTTAQSGLSVTATTDGGVTDSATVNVVAGPVASVTVTPSSATVNTGGTQQFSAAAFDAHGNAISGATFTWTATRGSVDATGLYTAPLSTGSDTVTATADGASGSASVAVTAVAHVSAMGTYDASGNPTTTFARTSTMYTHVTVRDQANNLLEGATVTIEIVKPNGQIATTASATTDANGVAKIAYTLPGGPTGTWTSRVTDISGTGITYDAAANLVSQVTFTVA